MLQDDLQDNRSLTAPAPTQADVTGTLSFNPANGELTFGSSTQPITGAFQIVLSDTQKIIVNAGEGIEFMPDPPGAFGLLPFNTSGHLTVTGFSATQIEIEVTQPPSPRGVLGFLLFIRFPGSPSVKGIETPSFFVTQSEPFAGPEFNLQFDRATGDFTLTERGLGGTEVPTLIPVEKGTLILRLGDDESNQGPEIKVFLLSPEEVAFANPPVLFTAPGSTWELGPNNEVVIDHPFAPGTGFGMSFVVAVQTGTDQTCTVISPDPIIMDKQIGGSG